jgi:hypothetical protein
MTTHEWHVVRVVVWNGVAKLMVASFLTRDSADRYLDEYPDDQVAVFHGQKLDVEEIVLKKARRIVAPKGGE